MRQVSTGTRVSQRLGRVHLGVTGEDLVRENIADADERVRFVSKLGFGHADVVVAVPKSWLDVDSIHDLEEVAAQFRRMHARRLRLATKYVNITGRFFANFGFSGYRVVGSLGATEGTPASGNADLIVDITSTGTTLFNSAGSRSSTTVRWGRRSRGGWR